LTRSSNAQQLSPQGVYKHASKSVYVVQALDYKQSLLAFGSGVAISADYIATNKHVVEEAAEIQVTREGGKWRAWVVYSDPVYDLCILRVDELNASPAPVRSSATLSIGEKVYAIGAPEGLELTLSDGLISGIRNLGGVHLIQTTAAISHGSSGGGLFDAQAQLVGITTFSLQDAQSLNFATPADLVLRRMEISSALPPAPSRRPSTAEQVTESKEIKHLFALADAGDVNALFLLAGKYEEGDGVPRDEGEAAKYYGIAADEGHAQAQLRFGDCHYYGKGVLSKSYTKAVEWYRKAAVQGVVEAQHNLGYVYAQGLGVPRDLVEAYMWYSISSVDPNVMRSLEQKMTPEQIAEARRRARIWAEGHPPR
jgi:hypothetical protein